MLCGTSDVLYSRKTVADYLANAAFFLSNNMKGITLTYFYQRSGKKLISLTIAAFQVCE